MSVEYPLFQFKDNGKILFEWHKLRHPKGSERIRRSFLEKLSPILDASVVDGSIDGRPNPAISIANLADPDSRRLFFGTLEGFIAEVRQLSNGLGKSSEPGGSGFTRGPQTDERSSSNEGIVVGQSKFLKIKQLVEFAAALIAVVGGILAFVRWIL